MSHAVWAEPLFFPPALWWQAWEAADFPKLAETAPFPKKGLMHRCFMPGPNGMQSYSLPLRDKKAGKAFRNLKIDWSQPAANDFLMAIKSNYGKSPYFEWFFEELVHIWTCKPLYLIDLNSNFLAWLCQRLGYPIPTWTSEEVPFEQKLAWEAHNASLRPYPQPFQDKLGFLQPASALDLLFNLGPETAMHLRL